MKDTGRVNVEGSGWSSRTDACSKDPMPSVYFRPPCCEHLERRMQGLIKGLVRAYFRIQCPDCLEMFDLTSDAIKEVVEAVNSGKQRGPWVCKMCTGGVKGQRPPEEEVAPNDGPARIQDLTDGLGRLLQLVEGNSASLVQLEAAVGQVSSSNQTIREEIKDIKEEFKNARLQEIPD